MQNTTTIKSYRNTKIKYRSEEWREKRHSMGIGGSEAAAITGLYPYRSALSVYYDKTNDEIKPEIQNEAMRQGADLEDYVAKRFCEATGKKVKKFEYMLQSKEHPIMLADVDRFVVGENAILECKVSQNYQKYSYEDADNIPAYQLIQCLHYMAVTGAQAWYIACVILGKHFIYHRIDRDEGMIHMLTGIEKDFWNNHIVPRIPPGPDGSKACDEILRKYYPESDHGEKIQLVGFDAQLERRKEIMELENKLQTERKTIEQQIQMYMQEAEAAESDRWRVTWKSFASSRIDSSRLKTDSPEIYKACVRPTVSRRFTAKEV